MAFVAIMFARRQTNFTWPFCNIKCECEMNWISCLFIFILLRYFYLWLHIYLQYLFQGQFRLIDKRLVLIYILQFLQTYLVSRIINICSLDVCNKVDLNYVWNDLQNYYVVEYASKPVYYSNHGCKKDVWNIRYIFVFVCNFAVLFYQNMLLNNIS